MKDVKTSFEVGGKIYPLVFNLNVMEAIQTKFESLDAWGDLTDGDAYAIRDFLAKNPEASESDWELLEEKEKAKYKGEPDAGAVIYGFREMINEGLDIENEELIARGETPRAFLSLKQVGRLITEYGLANATKKLNKTVVESTNIEQKNV